MALGNRRGVSGSRSCDNRFDSLFNGMIYPQNHQLEQITEWFEGKYAPAIQEAFKELINIRNGQFLKRIFLIRRGLRIAEWITRARTAEKVVEELNY